MARKIVPEPLTLPEPAPASGHSSVYSASPISVATKSPLSPNSPNPPLSPFRRGPKLQTVAPSPTPCDDAPALLGPDPATPTLSISNSSQTQLAPEGNEDAGRPTKSGFFSNYKHLKASATSKITQNARSTSTRPPEDRPVQDRVPDMTQTDKSTLPASRKPSRTHQRSETSVSPSRDVKARPKAFSLLNRTKTIRLDDTQSPVATIKLVEADNASGTPRSAPRPDNERAYRDMAPSTVRQRSEDRQPMRARDMSRDYPTSRSQTSFSSSLRETGGNALMNMVKSSSKAAGRLGGGFFKKTSRSGSMTVPEVDDEHYLIKVINLPLVEQTRYTRIAKRLEESRDKTEFWMPSFPWRAIDYLNYKGSDAEGLYRVPGSKTDIKRWQRRFDEELDVDLLEQDDLYDVNIIGSMFKQWLRELPDELLPKSVQDKIARECAGAEEVPQLLVDELSNLSPFNYYLLFAITCHLSLLISHSDKNKMTFNNLCICFQPCIKIDSFCFKFLVCDWQDCWKGSCKNEDIFLEQEYMWLDNMVEGRSSLAVESHDERNISSSDSSKPSTMSVKRDHRPPNIPISNFNDDFNAAAMSRMVSQTPRRSNENIRPLSPIAPLSPIGMPH